MSIPADPRASLKRGTARRDVALRAVLLLFLPVAFVGLVSQANEYRSWGGVGVDCDGPALLTFALPAAIVYLLGALVFVRRAIRGRRWGAGLAALACIALVAALANNIGNARRELHDPDHQATCGD